PRGRWGVRRCPIYLRRAHARIEITALMSNMVVIGKKNLNPGRSMTISPGRRNSGRRLTQDQARPSKMRLAPRVMSRRFIAGESTTSTDRPVGVRSIVAQIYDTVTAGMTEPGGLPVVVEAHRHRQAVN